MASSHGISTEWDESIWFSKHPMPRLYPNIVTLKSGSLCNRKIDSIGSKLPLGWAIKDSFGDLDLKNKGFTPAFDALWYCREPGHSVIKNNMLHYHVETVSSQFELNRWVTAWSEGAGIFISSLLENVSIDLIYVERNGQIVSELATNLSGNSVGISNLYGSPNELAGCIVSVIERHPEKAIVCYGSKAEIEALSDFGFKAIGNLRVWLCK